MGCSIHPACTCQEECGDGVPHHILAPQVEPSAPVASVADISDDKLLERAVRNSKRKRGEPKWAAVSNLFGLGSTYSIQLCRRFGIDPDQVTPMNRRRAREHVGAQS